MYRLDDYSDFELPSGLVKRGNFLVWTHHPWLSAAKTHLPHLQIPNVQQESKRVLAKPNRQSMKQKARQFLAVPSGVSVGSRTRGWSLVMPHPGSERVALALVSPQSFLVYELQARKKYKSQWKVVPKFPISQKLPDHLQARILAGQDIKVTELAKAVGVDPRGLQAAYNRARQHEYKFGAGLTQLVEQLKEKFSTT